MELQYGPDTEELLRRIATIEDGVLNLYNLEIHSLPKLPSGLIKLDCSSTQITCLPELPPELQTLDCSDTPLTTLHDLPSELTALFCFKTKLTSLPTLPSTLQILICSETQLTVLPEFPTDLTYLYCEKTPLIIKRKENEHILDYKLRWREWREEIASRERSQQRCRNIKEALMMEMWHPRRVEKLIEMGGFELLESF